MQLRNGTGLIIEKGGLLVSELTEPWEIPDRWTDSPDVRLGSRQTRYFCVSGWSFIGTTFILAKDASGSVRAQLDVTVKEKRKVRVNFVFIRDSAGHQTSRFPAAVPRWLARINEIFLDQANVEVVSDRIGWVTVPTNLGSVIRQSPGHDERWYVERWIGQSPDLTFCMVWEYESDLVTGVGLDQVREHTLGATCFFEDEARPDTGAAMAHEIGHFLGLRDNARKNHLMSFYPQHRGVYLSREEIDTINPSGVHR